MTYVALTSDAPAGEGANGAGKANLVVATTDQAVVRESSKAYNGKIVSRFSGMASGCAAEAACINSFNGADCNGERKDHSSVGNRL